VSFNKPAVLSKILFFLQDLRIHLFFVRIVFAEIQVINFAECEECMLRKVDPSLSSFFKYGAVAVLVASFWGGLPVAALAAGREANIPVLHSPDAEEPGPAAQQRMETPISSASRTFGMDAGAAPSQDEHSEDSAAVVHDEGILDEALDLLDAAQEAWTSGDEEKSLDTLDEAYAHLLEINANDQELSRQKEDIRLTISKRIMEIYASRYTVARGIHKEIPLIINKYVKREIQMFRGRERRFFLDSYKRSGRYRGEIVEALQKAGLPEELSWLPLIESGFKIRARSPARALGLWQFVPATAYKYGLRRNRWVDERLDPVKSTNAAIAYLSDLHDIFGDWATVLAAYNCGEGTVLRAIGRQKKGYLDGFWDLYERLPYETARYFPRFLAVLAILKDPSRYGFTLEGTDDPAPYETLALDGSFRLRTLARKLGVSYKDLRNLNPEIRRYRTPAGPYSLKVPPGKSSFQLVNADTRPENSGLKKNCVYHRVRAGETLSHIAVRYHTNMKAIIEMNGIERAGYIRVGQKLTIPLDDVS
jgi:peptidoglycan lytic transglycosylase D